MNIQPSLEKVKQLLIAAKGNLIPVYQDLSADLLTPIAAYLRVSKNEPYSFLFESVLGGEKIGRYSFIGTGKVFLYFRVPSNLVTVYRIDPYKIFKTGQKLEFEGDPLLLIEKEMKDIKYVPIPEVFEFTGGAIGYVSYDCVRYFEPRTTRSTPNLKDTLEIPDSVLMFCDTIIVFDHLYQTLRVVSHVFAPGNATLETAYEDARKKIMKTIQKLNDASPCHPEQGPISLGHESVSNVGKSGYENFVTQLKDYITEGDIIQAVPSQRLKKKTELHPFNAYRTLRRINPSPYMFYVNIGNEFQIVGASPEMLVKVSKGTVFTHPIAGTRKRGKTQAEDDSLAQELLSDLKERSEHIMLVDLGRNDVNRVCDPLSVNVDSLMHIERYSHVMHIVSNVSGTLRKDQTPFDAFRSIFPAGTVSGAPKIRAMEIIYSLEQEKRGVYAGAVGYFAISGDLDTCIAIRTMVFKDGHVYLQAGGGIVYDSIPEDEYEETLNKLRSNVTALERAEQYYHQQSHSENPDLLFSV